MKKVLLTLTLFCMIAPICLAKEKAEDNNYEIEMLRSENLVHS